MQYKIILKTLIEQKKKINENDNKNKEFNKNSIIMAKGNSTTTSNNFLFNTTTSEFTAFSNKTKENFNKYIKLKK